MIKITGNETIDFILLLSLVLCFVYMIIGAFYETADKQRVVNATKAFTQRHQRGRFKSEEAKELWESVEVLNRGKKVGIDEVQFGRIPAVNRKNNARTK